MAGNEKITLELITKLVDTGFKRAIKELNRVQKVEERRAKKNKEFAKAYIKDVAKRNEKLKRISEDEEKTAASLAKKRINIAKSMVRRLISLEEKAQRVQTQMAREESKKYIRLQKLKYRIEKNRRIQSERDRKREHQYKMNLVRLERKAEIQASKDAVRQIKLDEKKKRMAAKKTAATFRRNRQLMGSMSAGVGRIVSGFQSMAMYAGMAGVAIGAAVVKVTSVGATFEQSITNVGAIANLTGDQIGRLSAKARELGQSTAYTATEVANGMADLARAGLSVEKIMGAIGPTLYLAGAAGAEMGQATKLMARTMAQFGLDARDATRVADTFTLAMQNSLLDINSLDSSMRYAGAAAGAFGWDIGQTTAAVALFMDQTGMGSTAGTQFRHVLLSLAGPTKAAQKVMKDLAKQQGVSYKVIRDKLNPATSDFETILKTLKPVMKDHDKILKLVNKRSSGSLQKILKDYHTQSSKYGELTTLFAQSSGAALSTYDRQMSTVQGKTKIVQSKIQESFLQLFDGMGGPISKLLDSIMVMMDEVILVFEAAAPIINQMLYDAFSGAENSVQEAGDTIGMVSIKIINMVIHLIKNFPKIIRYIVDIGKKLIQIWMVVKGIFIVSRLNVIILGVAKSVHVLGSAFVAATWKARALMLTVGGILGAAVTLGGMALFDGAGEAFDSMSQGMGNLLGATEASERLLKAQSEALRGAKRDYEELMIRQGAGAAARVSTKSLRRTTTEMLEKTTGTTKVDKDIRNTLLDSLGMKEGAVDEGIEKGSLIDIESEIIPQKTRETIQEMTGELQDFPVSLQTVYAVARKLGDEEAKSFMENVKSKADKLARLREKTEQISTMVAEPSVYTESATKLRSGYLSPTMSEYESKKDTMKTGAGYIADADKKAAQLKEVGEMEASITAYKEANEQTLNALVLAEQLVANRDKLLDTLSGNKGIYTMVSEIAWADIVGGDDLAFTNEEINAITAALQKLKEEQGDLANSSLEIQKAITSVSTASEADIAKKAQFMTAQIDLLGKTTQQVRDEMTQAFREVPLGELPDLPQVPIIEDMMQDMMSVAGRERMTSLMFPGKEGELEIKNASDRDLLALKNLYDKNQKLVMSQDDKVRLLLYRRHVDPISKAYNYIATKDIPTDAVDKFQISLNNVMTDLIDFSKAGLIGSDTRGVDFEKDLTAMKSFKDTEGASTNRQFYKNLTDAGERATKIIGSLEDLVTKKTVDEVKKRDKVTSSGRSNYVDKMKAWYKKLLDMEKKQLERLQKLREDETDSLANQLKRRLQKTKEFFKEGYNLVKGNLKKTADLQRREAILLAQIRAEEILKVQKKTEKRSADAERTLRDKLSTERQKIENKMKDTQEKGDKARLTALKTLAAAGVSEIDIALKQTNDAIQELKDTAKGRTKSAKGAQGALGIFDVVGTTVQGFSGQALSDLTAQRLQLKAAHDAGKKTASEYKEEDEALQRSIDAQVKAYQIAIDTLAVYHDLLAKNIPVPAFGDRFLFNVDPKDLARQTGQPVSQQAGAALKRMGLLKDEKTSKAAASVLQKLITDQLEMWRRYDFNRTQALVDYNAEDLRLKKVTAAEVKAVQVELDEFEKKVVHKRKLERIREIADLEGATAGERLDEEVADFKELQAAEGNSLKTRAAQLQDFLKKRIAMGRQSLLAVTGVQIGEPMVRMGVDPGQKYIDRARKTGDRDEQDRLRSRAEMVRRHEEEKANIRATYRIDQADKDQEELERLLSSSEDVAIKMRNNKEKAEKEGKDYVADNKLLEIQKNTNAEIELYLAYQRARREGEEAMAILLEHQRKELGSITIFGKQIVEDRQKAMEDAKKFLDYLRKAWAIFLDLLDKTKQALAFFTGGNLQLNPFELMTQSAQDLISHQDEIKQKIKEIDEQEQAGRISKKEQREGRGILGEERKSAREAAKELIDKMIDESIRFVEALVEGAPHILRRLVTELPTLFKSLSEQLPVFFKILAESLPTLLPMMMDFILGLMVMLVENIPVLIDGFIAALPRITEALSRQLPRIIKAFVQALPKVISALAQMIPEIIVIIISTLTSLLTDWNGFWKPILNAVGRLIFEVAISLGKKIWDAIANLFTGDKDKKTKKYNDTPRPIRVTNSGLLARFAPGDTVIAAKEPKELMRQALMAVGSEVKMGTRKPPPPPPSSATQAGSSGSRIDIAVIAEGRVLDAVQMQALERGHAPKIAKRLRKASGVRVGFNRGRYNKFAVNET